MGEHSDTQDIYLPACSEPKSHLWVKTRVFWNSSYEQPNSGASETVQDVKNNKQKHSSVQTKHSKKRCFIHCCPVETSNMKKMLLEDICLALFQAKHSYP